MKTNPRATLSNLHERVERLLLNETEFVRKEKGRYHAIEQALNLSNISFLVHLQVIAENALGCFIIVWSGRWELPPFFPLSKKCCNWAETSLWHWLRRASRFPSSGRGRISGFSWGIGRSAILAWGFEGPASSRATLGLVGFPDVPSISVSGKGSNQTLISNESSVHEDEFCAPEGPASAPFGAWLTLASEPPEDPDGQRFCRKGSTSEVSRALTRKPMAKVRPPNPSRLNKEEVDPLAE